MICIICAFLLECKIWLKNGDFSQSDWGFVSNRILLMTFGFESRILNSVIQPTFDNLLITSCILQKEEDSVNQGNLKSVFCFHFNSFQLSTDTIQSNELCLNHKKNRDKGLGFVQLHQCTSWCPVLSVLCPSLLQSCSVLSQCFFWQETLFYIQPCGVCNKTSQSSYLHKWTMDNV